MRSGLNSSAKRKKGKRDSSFAIFAARWIAAWAALAFVSWSLAVPATAGALGQWLELLLVGALGLAAYLVPLALAYILFWRLRTQRSGVLIPGAGAALVVLGAAVCLATLGPLAGLPDWGGGVGAALAGWAEAWLGRSGALIVSAAAGVLGLQVLFSISWGRLLSKVGRLLAEDYRSWRAGRKELKELIDEARKRQVKERSEPVEVKPDAEGEVQCTPPLRAVDFGGGPRIAPIPLRAQNGGAAPAEVGPVVEEPAEESKPRARVKKEKEPGAAAAAPAVPGEYHLPPMDLLQAKRPGSHTGRPSDVEIQESVASLERTLQSFDIQARVSGISPGPVITRYEVSPAPGVTVNSIVARADDIALAMRAKGIRMIAPIPGKAAIGIEIPNNQPATVTLRDVLESPALSNNKNPLGFALGLSSDGTPLSADLQTMPHVLVAGATNSGKSVAVHALIASILFRRRPDEVKLLLIDPKRIELSLYDGIPHLYDPKAAPAQVQVITLAKQAAASLKALITVMERRYEKFQLYKVRDIAAFNKEALKRGEKAEFYIVVVIDELADLMVVARDVVEDSIQRLTQMARAVGIHLVLATQRPSVDVVTGVIKANLPSRIALRVASKVDSKVIVDGNGAEALLGKGDMLYVAPGQDPARVQGCFVSTNEIGALVDYLKTQGLPDYPVMETMGAVGEADLSQFGVEPLEFTQALKLVLQRRRVSQDLLKSQFGSSARATNILSLLEVKEFIHKPEGSNRWEIHFDRIEDYLRKHYPQIPLDKPGI